MKILEKCYFEAKSEFLTNLGEIYIKTVNIKVVDNNSNYNYLK
jgi:hypothetical protein